VGLFLAEKHPSLRAIMLGFVGAPSLSTRGIRLWRKAHLPKQRLRPIGPSSGLMNLMAPRLTRLNGAMLWIAGTPATWHVDQSPSRPSAPFDQAFYLILNVAIGGNLPEGRNLPGVSAKNFPKTMEIDWVRLYKCERSHDTAACGV